jgi:1-acyl-sn-glycerol-3-phosphate acyltransferase
MEKLLIIIRSLLSSLLFALMVIVIGSVLIAVTLVSSNKRIQNILIEFWAKNSLKIFGIHVKAVELEKVPSGACLLMFNHTSHFDILAIQSVIPRVRFGAKIELFSFPIFGLAMKRAGVLPIARTDIDAVKKVYKAAETRTHGGECFALAPEGTRQEKEKIGTFKSGPFIFAINAGIPIVPVLVKGCQQVYPKKNWIPATRTWTENVSITFGEPLQVQKGDVTQKLALQNAVHCWMEKTLEAN